MQLTYYGQSCFAVEVKKKNILLDPFIKYNPLARHINVNGNYTMDTADAVIAACNW